MTAGMIKIQHIIICSNNHFQIDVILHLACNMLVCPYPSLDAPYSNSFMNGLLVHCPLFTLCCIASAATMSLYFSIIKLVYFVELFLCQPMISLNGKCIKIQSSHLLRSFACSGFHTLNHWPKVPFLHKLLRKNLHRHQCDI